MYDEFVQKANAVHVVDASNLVKKLTMTQKSVKLKMIMNMLNILIISRI